MMSLLNKMYDTIYKKHYQLQKQLHELKSIVIEITNICNLNCKHCYMSANEDSGSDLSLNEWMSFFDQLKKDFGTKPAIYLTGGEPLMKKGFFSLLEYINKLGFNVTLTTNGTLITPENAILLKKYINNISISIDGREKNHDMIRGKKCFQKALDNIFLLKQAGISDIMIKTAVNKKNIMDLHYLYGLVKELPVNQRHIFPVEPSGRAEMQKDDFLLTHTDYLELCDFIDKIKFDKNHGLKISFGEQGKVSLSEKACETCKLKLCNAGIRYCSILYNGDIVACQGNRKFVQGNIKGSPLKSIWEDSFLQNRSKSYTSCGEHLFY